ncbi:NAD-dependent epimerase/dehydratase family protein [Kaistella antarctica]|uniref:Capsule biosynthesis protein CapI n=1 Tax=Kaistella antarctica TaxID=266748 RepID=A0A3S4VF16_9FLAO|nr:NAD-dependent epimerase/dehydratase family protein [Kaistella antarctica]KEY18771.1 capsule biosynthesis protein CapI [Kaistella antarctica]SEW15617.1 UDP-glucuronate 4-epimerase [Kaistella antarctica]VEH99543.1 dTDP-glucose 4,6-dehydratase [Kaistella antarctica]
MKILVTGAAGFIGYHLCEKLIALGHTVIGLDNINDYYDVNLKFARLNKLGISKNDISYNKVIESSLHGQQFEFIKMNLEDQENLPLLFAAHDFEVVCNLAAQAGVRYSIEQPMKYIESNIIGFVNLLECTRNYNVKKLVYASSSSVYGLNDKVPFSTGDNVDQPISMYAATKKSNELMAHTYSHLFGIETIGLRFFTVYGPWGRPDMAMFLFTDAILHDKPIKVFNEGNLSRDFTYIHDIVNGVVKTIEEGSKDNAFYKLYNIGNGNPVKLNDFITEIEAVTGKQADRIMMPMQPGDVENTFADVEGLKRDYNYLPNTNITVGVREFVAWYKEFYKIN